MKVCYRMLLLGGFLSLILAVFAVEAAGQLAAIAAVDEPEPAAEAQGSAAIPGTKQGASKASSKSTSAQKSPTTAKPSTTTKAKPKPPAKFNGPVLGDKYTFLNYEVVSVEKPYYTRDAKASGAKGLVQVEVLVAEDGSVLTAKARTGEKALWPEAERAALVSKFNRPKAYGRPARALGFLVYRFGPAEE